MRGGDDLEAQQHILCESDFKIRGYSLILLNNDIT